MENKKNNALEKAEKAQVKVNNQKKKSKKSPKEKVKEQKMQKRAERQKAKQEKRLEKQKLKAEKKKIEAQKRVELAKIKAHKKAEKQKAKATRLREKNRIKQERNEAKERLRKERLERRQMLKNESKKERQKRLAMERQAKHDRKMEIKRERAERKRQIRLEKRQKREQKSKAKQAKRKQNKGFGGWLTAVISLGVATLVLASVLTFTMLTPSANENLLNYNYQRSFYDVIEQVDNIDLNLSKVLASRDGGAMQKYLVDTAINSELAESDIQSLPLHDESKFYTAKLINQIGDFCKYLNNKLIDGESLTKGDMDTLARLYQANLELKNSLQKANGQMGEDYSFVQLDNSKDDVLISTLSELENLSVQYPELIYDGPFSDGQLNRTAKGLNGEEITFDKAREIFAKTFNDYSFASITSAGETNSKIDCYNIQGETDGEVLFAQFSKKGGNLIMFSYVGECNNTVVSEEKAIENALEFLEKAQIKNMQEVWINLTNNIYTINFAGDINGVVIYPDLVKVKVCAETGKVIGFEASEYYINHTERTISLPSISKESAKQKLDDGLLVLGSRKALIPIGTESEKLCYEFYCTKDEQTFYVYIDAMSGKQVQMFKVVSGTEGEFLM